MKEFIVIYITAPTEEVGKNIAKKLIEEKVAACINMVKNIYSIYWWKGNIEEDNEVLLIIKTKKDLFDKIEEIVKSIHPYTIPEIITLPIVAGSFDYLNWIDESTI